MPFDVTDTFEKEMFMRLYGWDDDAALQFTKINRDPKISTMTIKEAIHSRIKKLELVTLVNFESPYVEETVQYIFLKEGISGNFKWILINELQFGPNDSQDAYVKVSFTNKIDMNLFKITFGEVKLV